MRESDESSSVNFREIEPTVSLVGGRVFIGIRDHEIASGVVVNEADVEIENSEATVDELIRTDELKHQAARLLRLHVTIEARALSLYLNRVLETVDSNATSYFFFVEGDQLLVEAIVADQTVVAKVFLLPAKDGRLRIIIDEELWFGVTPVRSFTKELFDILHKALQSPVGLFAALKLSGPCEINFDAVNALSWALFPAQGWKLPLHRDLNIVGTQVNSDGRFTITAVSELAPRQLQAPVVTDTSQSPNVVKLLARQDAIGSIPRETFMLAGDTYTNACQKLFDAVPSRASSALIERLMIVGLADPSTQERCKQINSRELMTRPSSLSGLLCRAILSELEGDDERAITDYVEVANLGTGRIAAHAYRRAALAAAEIDAQRSLNFLEYAISLAPEHLGIKIDFAQAQAEAGQHAQAVTLLTQLLSTENIRPTSRLSMLIQMGSWLLFELDDLEASQECYEKALVLDPEHPDASLGLAQVFERKNEHQKAAEIFERLLSDAIEQQDMERASTLCMFLGDMWAPSDPEAALQRFQKALELDPNNESAKLRANQFMIPVSTFQEPEPENELEALLSLAAAAHSSTESSVENTEQSETSADTSTKDLTDKISRVCDAILSRTSIKTLLEILNEFLPELDADSMDTLRQEVRLSFNRTRDFRLYVEVLKEFLHNANHAVHKAEILTEIADVQRRNLRDFAAAEATLTEALGYVPTDKKIQENLAQLFDASDRFDSIFDLLGEEIFREHLEGMLAAKPQPNQKILDAARVLASSVDTNQRGRFYFELAERLDSVSARCTAIFEASHFEDISKSELLRFLSKVDVHGDEEDRATVLRTSLALEDDLDRRVEIRMALGECLAAQKLKTRERPRSNHDASATEKVSPSSAPAYEGDTPNELSFDIGLDEHFEGLITAQQLDQLTSRVDRLLQEGKVSWALGPAEMVRAATGTDFVGLGHIEPVTKLDLETIIQQISNHELNTFLGRLLSAYGADMSCILPSSRDDSLVELDEAGTDSELQKICNELSLFFGMTFKLVVDLRSDARARPLSTTPPSICLPADLLKNASLNQLRFEIGKWLTYIRIGGLVYAPQSNPEKFREWIELFYGVLDSDVLDRIPYEYASHVDRLRSVLSEEQKHEILSIREETTLENLLSYAARWPKVALRTAVRTGYLLSPQLLEVMTLIEDESDNLKEDLLDFLLSEGFVRILQGQSN